MPLPIRALAALGALAVVAACGAPVERDYPDPTGPRPGSAVLSQDSIFGPGGLSLGGRGDPGETDQGGGGIGVNSFLWRASLDTLAFMPLTSADPFGGVIITDWYSPPESPGERFKATVYILDRRLRADGIKVSVFRQVGNGAGQWQDAGVADGTVVDMENAILTRARELRIAALPQ